ncbi:sulfotransferase [Marinicella meishanensis]|uniref:sulfotransferase n=1 Tax=Marinicella meishanensis TaxID=2873263 RepID=UPI001CBBF0BE|nr:sulfotransferase [Marinicella sp. NBU2979]
MSTDKYPIFITGRFRSGTSFLWQIFDQLEGCCTWYEPLHPQLLTAIEYTPPKADHVGLADYWTAYRQNPGFRLHYSSDFATRDLYLEGKHKYRTLAAYIKHLMAQSGGDTPVLQFNRVDLRLGWLKANFPQARIIHIERDPIQEYLSQRKHIDAQQRDQADYWDAYELMPWCHALRETFPFLLSETYGSHAFYRVYALHRLSQLVAQVHADVTINLDDDVFGSDAYLTKLKPIRSLSAAEEQAIQTLKHVPEPHPIDPEQLTELQAIMDTVDGHLVEAGLVEYLGRRALVAIQFHHSAFWRQWSTDESGVAVLQTAVQDLAKEVQRVAEENQYYLREIDTLSKGQHRLDGMPETVIEVSSHLPEVLAVDELLAHSNRLDNAMTQLLAINDYLNRVFYGLKAPADAAAANTEQEPPNS